MLLFLLHVRTLFIGALGGLAGSLLGLPLGWLLGAMVCTIPLAVAGVRTPVSWSLRMLMISVIGVMVGGAFTPELMAGAREWIASLAGVALYVAMIAVFGVWFCNRIGRQDRLTAAFSAAPGGLSEMLALGPAMGADVRTMSLVHGMRLVVILFAVPAIVTAVASGAAGNATIDRSVDLTVAMPLLDAVLLIGCVVIGAPLGRRIRLPAANLTGPLILSAVIHLAEWTTSHPPQLMIIGAQVVIGASVATFFTGITTRQLLAGFAVGGGMTVITLVLAIVFALGFERYLDIPFATGLLALVPGGLPEMSLVSLSLGIDPAFVSMHHLFRVVLVLVLAPVLIPRWARAGSRDATVRRPPS